MSALRIQSDLNKMFRTKAPRQPDYDRKERAAFKALAGKIGMVYEISRDKYLEGDYCDVFPNGFITAFHGWDDVLLRLQHCVADPSSVGSDGSYSL